MDANNDIGSIKNQNNKKDLSVVWTSIIQNLNHKSI